MSNGMCLLGLPLDLLLQFGLGHHRHGDLADDHALPGDAQRALFLADFRVVEDLLQGLDHCSRVHHLPVDNHLRPQRGVARRTSPSPFRVSFTWQTLIDAVPMSTPTKFRPSPMMPLGKPTHTNACRKTLAPAESDSQKTGDCPGTEQSPCATKSETPETPCYPEPNSLASREIAINPMI